MSSFQSSLLAAVLLAIVGYFIHPFVGDALSNQFVFAFGLGLGGIFVALVSNSMQKITIESHSAEEGPAKTIYVGNLPYRASEAVIKELFEKYGQVHSVRLLKDRQTGKRRGFGFVEMSENDGERAIKALNDSQFQQRTLKVREAKERPEKHEGGELQTES